MLMTNDRSRPSTPVRSRSPHSRTIAASKSPSTRSAISMPATPGNAWRGPGAGSLLTTRTVLPSARSAKPSASCEPIESPSGRAGCRAARLVVAEGGVEDARLLDVGADLDAGQRHEPDARIVDFARQERRELGADLVGDAIGTRALRHNAGNQEFGIRN